VLDEERSAVLVERAAGYAAVALRTVRQEYPHDLRLLLTGPTEVPPPRRLHPAFYGNFDWHSCVEMHWALLRLLRAAPDALPGDAWQVLDEHLSAEAIAIETAFLAEHPAFSRPYGQGWALMLAEEAARGPQPLPWAAAVEPLADQISRSLAAWLPKGTYPVRHGVHVNSAFGLRLALPWARRRAATGDPALLAAVRDAARRWFARDADYPGGWEPSGSDFLSPALTEAELMVELAGPDWLDSFLPRLADGAPAALLTPAIVSDSSDSQIAHLHGLNLSRAWAWRRLAEALPAGDPRVPVALDAARRHAAAGLPHVIGSDYMVEHWLVPYALLHLTG
jgi:Protein of unknown function (DUF2891)